MNHGFKRKLEFKEVMRSFGLFALLAAIWAINLLLKGIS